MSKRILVVTVAFAAVFSATAAAATVNCNVVNRELKLGKWPADVALGMGVTLSEVNRCKANPPPHSSSVQKSSTAPKRTAPAKNQDR